MATKSLATNKALLLQAGEGVERGGNEKEDSRCDEASGLENKRQPLDERHDPIDASTHKVGLETADEVVEARRGRADAQEQRDLEEEDYERAYTEKKKRC